MTPKQLKALQESFIGSGIMRDPKSYTADELKRLNPRIPTAFIDDYVDVRDGNKSESDYKRIPLKIDDI